MVSKAFKGIQELQVQYQFNHGEAGAERGQARTGYDQDQGETAVKQIFLRKTQKLTFCFAGGYKRRQEQ